MSSYESTRTVTSTTQRNVLETAWTFPLRRELRKCMKIISKAKSNGERETRVNRISQLVRLQLVNDGYEVVEHIGAGFNSAFGYQRSWVRIRWK